MARILVIDDDQDMRQLMKTWLEMKGHEVEDAASGKEGVDKYREAPFDLVITDILMPDQDGIETISALKKSDPEAKIIAISGGGRVAGVHYLQLAYKLGALGTLAKPFDWSDMFQAVNEALEA